MELTPEIRQRLKSIMDSKNDTGYTLNKKLGISATTIGNYINGKITKADNTKIKAMCDLWGIDMEWLVSGCDMVKSSDHPQGVEDSAGETTEHLMKQILQKLNNKDDQFSNLRKDLRFLREDMGVIKKEFSNLTQEVADLKTEIKKLKGNS